MTADYTGLGRQQAMRRYVRRNRPDLSIEKRYGRHRKEHRNVPTAVKEFNVIIAETPESKKE